MTEFSKPQEQASSGLQATIERLGSMTAAKTIDADINSQLGERHAEYVTNIERRLQDPNLSEGERAMWEDSLEWQHQQVAERAYMNDPSLPRPEHLPPLMSEQDLAASMAKVNSVTLR